MNEWWDHQTAGTINALLVSFLVLTCGLGGVFGEHLASQGSAKALLTSFYTACIAVGLALLAIGALAAALDQPAHIYRPLLLTSSILTTVQTILLVHTDARYNRTGQRSPNTTQNATTRRL
jgi:hypothetical protein